MSPKRKRLSNPFSTGNGGPEFESHVQASFIALMLTGGCSPVLPPWPIIKLKLQAKVDGYETDDMVVFVEDKSTRKQVKLLVQVKHAITISKENKVFGEVIQAAWLDFNDGEFVKGQDAIALVTGPLSRLDFHSTKWVLDQAKSTADCTEFLRNLDIADFSPPHSRKKYEAIKHHVIKANNGDDVSDETVYKFLKDYHLLGYDLGGQVGVVLSLLQSHIGQLSDQPPDLVWSHLVTFVQDRNKKSGTIVPDNIPSNIRDLFHRKVAYIPSGLYAEQDIKKKVDLSQYKNGKSLVLFSLLGGWDQDKEADKKAVEVVAKEGYDLLIEKVKALLDEEESPIALRNGQWSVSDRKLVWDAYAKHIYDDDLINFEKVALEVLSERDPSFEMDADKRYMASMEGKVLSHSEDLRSGVAEALALMGAFPNSLVKCTKGRAGQVVGNVIGKILFNADWVMWGSLNSLLPLIAEADPDLFIKAVENALAKSPSPFSTLFEQENGGFTGRNYMTGLLYALETLAWQEDHLVPTCMILGKLADIDPGGQWANRPSNSLISILLPWMPQTRGSIEKRKVAVKTLFKEFPKVASRLAFNLLPNQVQSTSGTRKPVWRDAVPDDTNNEIDHQEYFEQVSNYAEMLVDWADHEPKYLSALIEKFGNLPKGPFDRLLQVLSSDELQKISDDDRLMLWGALTNFVRKNRRFADATWAVTGEALDKIDEISEKFEPSNPFYKHRLLFSGNDYDQYEENGDYVEQMKKLEDRRAKAVKDIFEQHKVEGVIQFAEMMDESYYVGYSFGTVAEDDADEVILPALLESKDRKKHQFSRGYVFRRHQLHGCSWADKVLKEEWPKQAIANFLMCLPFNRQTWERVDRWLGKKQGLYWASVRIDAHSVDDGFDEVVEKLLENGRDVGAIEFIHMCHFRKKEVSPDLVFRALMDAVKSKAPWDAMNAYHVVEVIVWLQNLEGFDEDKLFQIEWAYLPILERHVKASPKLVEGKLASDPDFFSIVVSTAYRPEGAEEPSQEKSEDEMAMARNAWKLLRHWSIVPGTQADGHVDGEKFKFWLERVIELCRESKHLSPALYAVGAVAIHCPEDESGLWINKSVAEAMNGQDADVMRTAYKSAVINSRGAHMVDPTGKPEKDLASGFNEKADSVENEGYHRLASTLRDLAKFYLQRAQEIIDEHGS